MSNPVLRPPETPPLSPPGHPPAPNGRGSRLGFWVILAALVLLVGLAVAVIRVLPELNRDPGFPVKTPRTPASVTAAPSPPETAAPVTGKTTPARQSPGGPGLEASEVIRNADTARQNWFEKKARAELGNMQKWGGSQYREALALAEKGSLQIQRNEFSQAAQSFSSAAEKISILNSTRNKLLEKAIEKGRAALDKADAAGAEKQFNLALSIDPENSEAKNGLERAATIVSVSEMLHEARGRLETGNLDEAEDLLYQAVQIDPEFTAASNLLEETRGRIRKQNFDRAMGKALSALAGNDLSKSRRALEQAAKIFPRDPAVKELSGRLQQAEKAQGLKVYLEKARDYSRKEQWSDACSQYEKALGIAPHNLSVLEGAARARKLFDVQSALEKIILHPERLREAGPLKDARQTIRIAAAIRNKGPVLSGRIEQAEKAVRLAVSPVPVTFISDGQTEITIFHLGRLGRLRRRTISMKPGIYTAAGTRPGYRDVRKKFVVEGEKSSVSVSIACDEKI